MLETLKLSPAGKGALSCREETSLSSITKPPIYIASEGQNKMSWMKTLFLQLCLQLRHANSFTHQDLRSRCHLRVVDLFTHMHARITQAPRRNYHLHCNCALAPFAICICRNKVQRLQVTRAPFISLHATSI